ncbi:ABC-three component system protein [Paenibacillus alba]|uniref:ABC-three component systems C-terminal domain-containing protein n=1 Tax=Paenibacillus alba TaxID=1197127 RepID=A0ABU6G687_9BACL|nr:ABC-three component system protein [Paenibacillus alba]MEC0228747.1 hypothetical protein [Paenibacillus alba]
MRNQLEKFEKSVCRLSCGEGKDIDRGTAFLISTNQVVTATHNISNYLDEGMPILLEFLNLSSLEPITRTAVPVVPKPTDAITFLYFDEPLESKDIHLCFSNYEINHGDFFQTYGYPTVKWDVGQWTNNKVSRFMGDHVYNLYDWNIDLDHNSNIKDFSGLSGAPLFINGYLVGVVLAESMENHEAISLGAISCSKFSCLLSDLGLEMKEIDEHLIFEPEDKDYVDYTFIEKLESAKIFETSMCQKEFYNAEILQSMVESKGVKSEVQAFYTLKENVHSVWHTKYIGYKDTEDGSELLSKVYERIEDLDSKILESDKRITLYAKKGMLHQLAEECRVGWVKNYQQRLSDYRLVKGDGLNE